MNIDIASGMYVLERTHRFGFGGSRSCAAATVGVVPLRGSRSIAGPAALIEMPLLYHSLVGEDEVLRESDNAGVSLSSVGRSEPKTRAPAIVPRRFCFSGGPVACLSHHNIFSQI